MASGALADMATRTTRRSTSSQDSAVKKRVHPLTRESYAIVSQQMPDGQFIASIAEDQTFCATAATRQEAEDSSSCGLCGT